LSPKKIDLIPKKVVSPPKTIDSFPEKVDFIPKTACLQAFLWQGFGIPSEKTNTEK
jgi:hypothetical protein